MLQTVKMQLTDRKVDVDEAGWYMAIRGMGRGSQSGGHAEGLGLTGVVGG